jgi:hypothetical protein
MRTAKDAFLLKEWLAADAHSRLATDPTLPQGVSCDEAGCVTQLADGALVALALRPEALADDCERAALVVTARQTTASLSTSGDRHRSLAKAGRDGPKANPKRICGGRRQAERRRSAVVAGGRGWRRERNDAHGTSCGAASRRCDATGSGAAVG